jgi:hypothetical protein
MLGIWFDRIEIDDLGQYIENKNHPAIQNFLNYSLASAEELSQREEPLIIPAAPILPTRFEKQHLIGYIKDRYPKLWNNSPQLIEETIIRLKNIHKEYVNLVKKASIIK